MDEIISLNFDGGSRGNPGPAGIGIVLAAADGTTLLTLGRFIGRATNNVAEYMALITGLEQAQRLGALRLNVHGDSELVIRQMRGEYRVRHPDLIPLHRKATDLAGKFEKINYLHDLRHRNAMADKLANLAMDKKCDVDEDGSAVSLEDVIFQPRTSTKSSAAPTPSHAPLRKAVPTRPAHRGAESSSQLHCHRCGCVLEIKTASSLASDRRKDFICCCGTPMNS